MAKKSFKVAINVDWCKACGICIALCPVEILKQQQDGRVEVIDESRCTGCKSCVIHCPDFCFEVKELAND